MVPSTASICCASVPKSAVYAAKNALATKPGRLAGEFFLVYALVRMIGETYREPDAGLILGLSRGTFYSIFLVVAAAALFAVSRRAKPLALPSPSPV